MILIKNSKKLELFTNYNVSYEIFYGGTDIIDNSKDSIIYKSNNFFDGYGISKFYIRYTKQ